MTLLGLRELRTSTPHPSSAETTRGLAHARVTTAIAIASAPARAYRRTTPIHTNTR
jgi:hypothetical protein